LLFFIDETWQTIGGRDVGAMAAVAIPRTKYNAFCREVWQIKQNVLGAEQLSDCEIKGNSCFAKSAFRTLGYMGHSTLLQAADETIEAITKYGGNVFAVWTDDEEYLLLKNPEPGELSQPYRKLLEDFKHRMEIAPRSGAKGLLFFDHRGKKEDLGAACAVQNFLARYGDEWRQQFIQTPHFTPSAVGPGIQAADLVAYLAAHRADPSVRPELKPYWRRIEKAAFVYKGRRALGRIKAPRQKERAGRSEPRKRR
jgi:Protein of unknown function (DUF3800)